MIAQRIFAKSHTVGVYSITAADERDIVRDVKQTRCFASVGFDSQKENLHVFRTENHRCRCRTLPWPGRAVPLAFSKKKTPKIHVTIEKCDVDLRKDLYADAVLPGGHCS